MVTTLLGALILAGWPGNTLFMLGMFFSASIWSSMAPSWIALGLKLRGHDLQSSLQKPPALGYWSAEW